MDANSVVPYREETSRYVGRRTVGVPGERGECLYQWALLRRMKLGNTLFQKRHPETHILPQGLIRTIDYFGIASRHVLVKDAGAMDVYRFKTDHNVVYAKVT
eukprot:569705-Heterocapsa_arctica.AAC.1